jgi:hypothetical protein
MLTPVFRAGADSDRYERKGRGTRLRLAHFRAWEENNGQEHSLIFRHPAWLTEHVISRRIIISSRVEHPDSEVTDSNCLTAQGDVYLVKFTPAEWLFFDQLVPTNQRRALSLECHVSCAAHIRAAAFARHRLDAAVAAIPFMSPRHRTSKFLRTVGLAAT